jgi:hypothetical protein
MKDLSEMIVDVADEILRVENFLKIFQYNNGSAVSQIALRYRKELKDLKLDFEHDQAKGIVNYETVPVNH